MALTAGARVNLLVKEVITNASGFERSLTSDSAMDLAQLVDQTSAGKQIAAAECSQRLVIQPRHDPSAAEHNCPICPANLCKVWPLTYHEDPIPKVYIQQLKTCLPGFCRAIFWKVPSNSARKHLLKSHRRAGFDVKWGPVFSSRIL